MSLTELVRMSASKPKVVKSTVKAASGGVIVVVALLALMFLQGPGTGSGETDGEGLAPVKPTMVTTEPPETPDAKDDGDSAAGGLTDDEQKALSGNVLGILIDERSYLLEVPTGTETDFVPAELRRLLELAAMADGDSNGIRIRILQRETARAKAEQDLRQALGEIGIGTDAIYMPAEFVPASRE